MRVQHRCFPVNIAKFLKTAIFIEQPPVTAFGYRAQSNIFREVTASKFHEQRAAQSHFCRYEGLWLATK